MSQVTREQRWRVWRGSPELLAQAMRATLRAVGTGENEDVTCTIDFEVDGDHELFASPPEFTAGVTREALRHFKLARFQADGSGAHAEVAMAKRPWWEGAGFPPDSDAEVRLRITGPDRRRVDSAFEAACASIGRGGRKGLLRRGATMFAVVIGVYAAVIGAVVSALFLAGYSGKPAMAIWIGIFAIAFTLAIFFGSWLYPPLEVAPPGQTNLARLVKFGGPLVLGFLLTGLAKLLFG